MSSWQARTSCTPTISASLFASQREKPFPSQARMPLTFQETTSTGATSCPPARARHLATGENAEVAPTPRGGLRPRVEGPPPGEPDERRRAREGGGEVLQRVAGDEAGGGPVDGGVEELEGGGEAHECER